MSVMHLRVALTRRVGYIRPLLLATLGAALIIVGLLSMHGMGGTAEHSVPASTQAHAVGSESLTHDKPASTDLEETAGDCSSMCPTGDMMSMLACVVALMVGALLVGVRPKAMRVLPRHLISPRISRRVEDSAPPEPPDLNVLSISRT